MDQKKIGEIIKRAKSDKRSADEIFQSIADLLVEEHNVPKEQSIEAARNLISFCEAIMEVVPQEDGE